MPAKKSSSSSSKKKSTASSSPKKSKKTSTSPVVKKETAPKSSTPAFSAANTSQEDVFLTEKGLADLKQELDTLKNVRRKEVAERLKEAISYGDLSENAEYEEAKNEQAFVEGRILELEKKIKHAKIIHGKKQGMVRIGSTVAIKEKKSGEKATYTIVGSTEADPTAARISNESPVGKAVLGSKKGDVVTVQAPVGKIEYEILSIS